jgi:hypothetical protein
MANETVEGIGESLIAMDDLTYSDGLTESLLTDNYEYKFEKIEVVSDMGEFGEVQMMVIGRSNINKVECIKPFLEELYGSCVATFNIKSGRADRKVTKDVGLYGYRKCIMQVHNPNLQKPRMKGSHQDCQAKLNFKMDKPKVKLILEKCPDKTNNGF